MDPNRECSNYGCSVKFTDGESNPVCQFHPGGPVFHEGYKFWGCCKKRVIHFDDFLNQKGCTEGEHCWIPRERPVPEALKEELLTDVKEVQEIRSPLNAKPRPDPYSQLVNLNIEISPTFQKLVDAGNSAKKEELLTKSCQNAGCSVEYVDRESNPECQYHSGEAIFHEGLKYWSCCKKKAMEFEEFLKQKGCTKGDHCWTSQKKAVECRFDWHQTGTHVIGAIYVKGYSPCGVKIQANSVRLQVSIDLPSGVYKKDWVLQGIIDNVTSSACLMSTKVEIKLKKAEPVQWTDFVLKET